MTPEPDPIEVLAEEGEVALEDGEYELALESFEAILKKDPEHWGASLRCAECLHLLWRTAEALKAVPLPRRGFVLVVSDLLGERSWDRSLKRSAG